MTHQVVLVSHTKKREGSSTYDQTRSMLRGLSTNASFQRPSIVTSTLGYDLIDNSFSKCSHSIYQHLSAITPASRCKWLHDEWCSWINLNAKRLRLALHVYLLEESAIDINVYLPRAFGLETRVSSHMGDSQKTTKQHAPLQLQHKEHNKRTQWWGGSYSASDIICLHETWTE